MCKSDNANKLNVHSPTYTKIFNKCMSIFQSKEELAQLYCYYERKRHPMLLIRPLKVEIVNHEPYIVMLRDVMYDSEIDYIKARAAPMVSSLEKILNAWFCLFAFLCSSSRSSNLTLLHLVKLINKLIHLSFSLIRHSYLINSKQFFFTEAFFDHFLLYFFFKHSLDCNSVITCERTTVAPPFCSFDLYIRSVGFSQYLISVSCNV